MEIHAQEMQNQKQRNNEILKVLEEENKKLKDEINKKEIEFKESVQLKENICSNYEIKLKDIVKENSQLKKEKNFYEEEIKYFYLF